MRRNGLQRRGAPLLRAVASPEAAGSCCDSCDRNGDSITLGDDEAVAPSAVVATPSATLPHPDCSSESCANLGVLHVNDHLMSGQLAAGGQLEPNPETGTCNGEGEEYHRCEEYPQRSSATKSHHRKVPKCT